MIYESKLTETREVPIRIRANSKEEADQILNEIEKNEQEYLSEELDLNAESWWTWEELKEVHPAWHDEAATVTKEEDGSFTIVYEGGDEGKDDD